MTLQHLRSSTANKRPLPGSMSDGQIAINTNTSSPGLFFKDSAGALVKVGPVHVGSTAPNASPASGGETGNTVGEQWLDTSGSTYVFKIWDGSAWRSEAGEFVNVTGDVMTGALGIIAGSAGSPGLYFSGDTNTGIYSPGADQVALATGGTGRLFVDASGHIGLTASASAWGDSANGSRAIQIGGSSWYNYRTSIVNFGHGYYYDASDNYRYVYTGVPVSFSQQTAGEHRWFGASSGTAGNSFTPQERMRLDSSGRLGLGTSSPAGTLHVNGQTYIQGAVSGGNSNSTLIGNNAGQAQFWALGADTSTTGSMTFVVARSNLSSSLQAMTIDSSARVGVGTSTPGTPLHVSAAQGIVKIESSTGTNSTLAQFTNTAGNAFVGLEGSAGGTFGTGAAPYSLCMTHQGAYPLHLITSNVVRATIDSSGRVGIGTTSPGGKLSVVTTTNTPGNSFGGFTDSYLAVQTGTSATSSGLGFGYDSTNDHGLILSVSPSVAWRPIRYIAGDHRFEITGGIERARIDSSGRLLVGTSSAFDTANTGTSWLVGIEKPSGYSALSIKTNEASSNGAYLNLGKSRGATANSKTIVNDNDELGGIYFEGADGASMRVGARVAAFVDGTPGASDLPTRLVFSTTADGASSPTERMRITNAGLHYFMANGNDTTRIQNTAAAGTATSFLAAYHSSTAGTVNTGTLSLNITTNGNITNTNNSYGAISDIKLKENIVDATSQWDDIRALQVRKYNFKEGQTHTQIGLVAQEVELVSPGLVTESPDRDAEGNDLGTVTKSVNYSVLYMKAVKALQEAMERIETLEAKVAALEGV